MKPKHQRLLLILIGMAMLGFGGYTLAEVFKENIIYFYTPSELEAAHPDETRAIRLGGLVKAGSVKKIPPAATEFIITDNAHEIAVRYEGPLPSLFREGQGVIAEGKLVNGTLAASTVLAKHDERYMPPGVAEKLKQSGHWHPQ